MTFLTDIGKHHMTRVTLYTFPFPIIHHGSTIPCSCVSSLPVGVCPWNGKRKAQILTKSDTFANKQTFWLRIRVQQRYRYLPVPSHHFGATQSIFSLHWKQILQKLQDLLSFLAGSSEHSKYVHCVLPIQSLDMLILSCTANRDQICTISLTYSLSIISFHWGFDVFVTTSFMVCVANSTAWQTQETRVQKTEEPITCIGWGESFK